MGMDHNLHWFHSVVSMVYSYGDAMIEIKLLNSPGYPTTNPNYLGTVHHYLNGAFAVGVNCDYGSTLAVRRYLGGVEPPNYPLPALLQDSQSDLALRWSNWLDDDRLSGHKY